MMILVTGGTRSGKSSFAEKLAAGFGRVTYVATAQAFDDEMKVRIERHKLRRPSHWATVEAPFDADKVVEALRAECFIFDCLTVYLSNFMCRDQNDSTVDDYIKRLIDAARNFDGTAIFVTNEVGNGIVPENALAREFRDWQGLINQRFAAAADEVYLCVCGIPMKIK